MNIKSLLALTLIITITISLPKEDLVAGPPVIIIPNIRA
jgi:hypothetical protein